MKSTPDSSSNSSSNSSSSSSLNSSAKSRTSSNSNANSDKKSVQGEGDYNAARRYNKASKEFVDSGAVPDAARDAAPHSQVEAQELEDAEQVGLDHAKGEDPQVKRP